jgi:hypothetical protein
VNSPKFIVPKFTPPLAEIASEAFRSPTIDSKPAGISTRTGVRGSYPNLWREKPGYQFRHLHLKVHFTPPKLCNHLEGYPVQVFTSEKQRSVPASLHASKKSSRCQALNRSRHVAQYSKNLPVRSIALLKSETLGRSRAETGGPGFCERLGAQSSNLLARLETGRPKVAARHPIPNCDSGRRGSTTFPSENVSRAFVLFQTELERRKRFESNISVTGGRSTRQRYRSDAEFTSKPGNRKKRKIAKKAT